MFEGRTLLKEKWGWSYCTASALYSCMHLSHHTVPLVVSIDWTWFVHFFFGSSFALEIIIISFLSIALLAWSSRGRRHYDKEEDGGNDENNLQVSWSTTTTTSWWLQLFKNDPKESSNLTALQRSISRHFKYIQRLRVKTSLSWDDDVRQQTWCKKKGVSLLQIYCLCEQNLCNEVPLDCKGHTERTNAGTQPFFYVTNVNPTFILKWSTFRNAYLLLSFFEWDPESTECEWEHHHNLEWGDLVFLHRELC